MKKIFILALLFICLTVHGQSTEDVINQITGEMDEALRISTNASYAELGGIALTSVPLVLFPVSLVAPAQHRQGLEISYYTFSAIALVTYLTSFIISEVYKKEANDKLHQLYEYRKITSDNYYHNLEFNHASKH